MSKSAANDELYTILANLNDPVRLADFPELMNGVRFVVLHLFDNAGERY